MCAQLFAFAPLVHLILQYFVLPTYFVIKNSYAYCRLVFLYIKYKSEKMNRKLEITKPT